MTRDVQTRVCMDGSVAGEKFGKETWHLNGFNLCEVIVIRDGPDERGHRYIDGRHQVRVALYEDMRAAAEAVRQHNSTLAITSDPLSATRKDAQR